MTRKGMVPFHPLACFWRWEETHTKGICQTSSRQSAKLRFEPGTLSWGPAAITFSSVYGVLKGKAIHRQKKRPHGESPLLQTLYKLMTFYPLVLCVLHFPLTMCEIEFLITGVPSVVDSVRAEVLTPFVCFAIMGLFLARSLWEATRAFLKYTFCCSGCLFWLADGFVNMAIARKLTKQVQRSNAHLSMSSHGTGDGWSGDISCWAVRRSHGGIECDVLLEAWTITKKHQLCYKSAQLALALVILMQIHNF